jgi:NAD+ kinase
MNIAIYARSGSSDIIPFMQELTGHIASLGGTFMVYHPFYNFLKQNSVPLPHDIKPFSTHEEIRDRVDYVFTLGGDGTLLETLTIVKDSGIPVLGINTGRLGFLASVSGDKLGEAVKAITNERFSIEPRSLIRLETSRDLFGDTNYALNEVTIHKKDSSSMIIIHTYLNGEYLNSYWADGLIIATPTGSTGYSLSCGGPIIVPHSDNFVITPIAPHNLNVRPIVVSDKYVISLQVAGRSQYFLASLDSRSVTIDSGIELAARKEDFAMNIIRLEDENFLGTIRNKLMWGLDVRN